MDDPLLDDDDTEILGLLAYAYAQRKKQLERTNQWNKMQLCWEKRPCLTGFNYKKNEMNGDPAKSIFDYRIETKTRLWLYG